VPGSLSDEDEKETEGSMVVAASTSGNGSERSGDGGARRWSGRGGGGRGGGTRGGEGSETAVVAMAGRSGAGEVRRQSCASAGGVGPTE
jgi:hypothetical protein